MNGAKLKSTMELLRRLIAFRSISREPSRPIGEFVAQWLADHGASVWTYAYEDGRKLNVLARAGDARPDRRGLLLCGHLDVVPADEPDWHSNPFELVQRNGRLYGRGAADMKGFVALAMQQLAAAAAAGGLDAPLWLLLTSDEEIGAVGASRLVDALTGTEGQTVPSERDRLAGGRLSAGALPRACVIGEPTRLRPVRLHKGHLKLRITIDGRPGHSAYPAAAVNAVERAAPLLGSLVELARLWRSRPWPGAEVFDEAPHPVLNVARVCAGRAINIVPDRCVIELGIRTLPGQCHQTILDALRRRAAAAGIHLRDVHPRDGADEQRVAASDGVATAGRVRGDALHDALECLGDTPPLSTASTAAVVRALCALTGHDAGKGVSFASDAGVLAALGLECVLCGPGDIRDAHRADESLSLEQLGDAAALLEQLVARFCMGSADA